MNEPESEHDVDMYVPFICWLTTHVTTTDESHDNDFIEKTQKASER